jgi:hypothetical protein
MLYVPRSTAVADKMLQTEMLWKHASHLSNVLECWDAYLVKRSVTIPWMAAVTATIICAHGAIMHLLHVMRYHELELLVPSPHGSHQQGLL